MTSNQTIRVSKLDAARRQLDTAIEMWFFDSDPVAVHTLAAAAHQIIHDINETKGDGKNLLFDTKLITDDYRPEFLARIRKPTNFFKHADRDPEGIVEFDAETTMIFFTFSILGMQQLGEQISDRAIVLLNWIEINHPEWTTTAHQQRVMQSFGTEGIAKAARSFEATVLRTGTTYRCSKTR